MTGPVDPGTKINFNREVPAINAGATATGNERPGVDESTSTKINFRPAVTGNKCRRVARPTGRRARRGGPVTAVRRFTPEEQAQVTTALWRATARQVDLETLGIAALRQRTRDL